MANYKEIQGFPIQNLSSDPVPFAQAKENNPYAGVWSSGGNLNTDRVAFLGSFGSQTAQIAASGNQPPSTYLSQCEQYNGTSWTEIADVNDARNNEGGSGSGTTTAGLVYGGNTPGRVAVTESWNGSAWTEVSDLNTARNNLSGVGTSTASLAFFGQDAPGGSGYTGKTESWDGTSWTETADGNTARGGGAGMGTSYSACFNVGGYTGPAAIVESWNGSAWTEIADLNEGRGNALARAGTTTAGLVAGGYTNPGASRTGSTESWDGSSWTEVNDLAVARYALGGQSPSNTVAIAYGGNNPSDSPTAATEEWAFSGIPPTAPAAGYSDAIVGQMYYNSTTGQFKAIKDGGAPIGTWASGGSTNTVAGQRGGASRSSTTNAFVSGGFRMGVPDTTTNAESYDGTSWTEGPNQPATNRIGAAWGTTISYVTAGGSTGIAGAPINPYAFEWNGTSFSNGGTMNNARRNAAGAGLSETAGRAMAGGDNPGPAQAFNESYNGTSFTEETDINTARIRPIGFGTTTSAIIASGSSGTNVEQWDGSSWTEIAEVLTATANSAGGAGTTTDGLIFTRTSPSPTVATTQYWNGSSWTEVAELSVVRYANTGGGAGSTNAISVGGYGPPTAVTTATEEWSAGDFDITTLTTS